MSEAEAVPVQEKMEVAEPVKTKEVSSVTKSPEKQENGTANSVQNGSSEKLKTPEKIANGNGKKPLEKPQIEEATRAFAQGKREVTMKDYGAAVTSLAKACELYTALYGELGDELGDVYFSYGKALFANARSESTVLGDQIKKDKEEDDDDEDDDGDAEESEENSADAKPDEEGGDDKTEKGEEGAGEEDEDKEGEGEDADDLQLSWEVLEMAKVIYQRTSDEDKETAIKLSEVYLTLGENGLESESYDTAVSDMQSCLEIQKKNLGDDDRRIAETMYQLGVAYSLGDNFDDAITSFQGAITQLEKRLASLGEAKAAGKKHPDNETQDSSYTIDGEVSEIDSVIKDIREKVVDMEDHKKHLKNELAKQMGFGPSSSGASSSTAPPSAFSSSAASSEAEAKPISNISHLVRKKRKNEDEEEGSSEKKTKTDETN